LRLKIFKKLRTASLNSEFTGSYKKKCNLDSNRYGRLLWLEKCKILVWKFEKMLKRESQFSMFAKILKTKCQKLFC